MDPLCYPKLVWWTYFLILFSTKSCENHRNKTYDMKHRQQITMKFQELKVFCLHCQYTFRYLVLSEFQHILSMCSLFVTYVPSTALFNAILMSWSNRPLMIVINYTLSLYWLDLYSKFCLALFRTLVG